MPLQRRLPKRGFKNIWGEEVQEINLRDLERLGDAAEVTPELLAQRGLIRKAGRPVKLLGEGEISKAMTIHVTAASKSAVEKVEKAGGKVIVPEPAPKRGKYLKRELRAEAGSAFKVKAKKAAPKAEKADAEKKADKE